MPAVSERRIAVVTGAGAGIGAAVARTLARDGYSLALLDRDDVELKRVTAELAETIVDGADVASHVVDVTDRQAVDAAVASTMDTFGRIDALAHVAGILDTGSVLDSDPDQWQKIFGVNVFGLLNVLQSVGREMRRRRAGAIVVVSSNAAGVPRMGMGAYGSSKAAATMLVRTAGLELAADGIRVNVVAPGSTDTAMQRSLWSDPSDDSGADAVIEGNLASYRLGIPLGKLATADDIADSVHFLLSDRAAHITMQALYVDGGATLKA
ncbi:2,3-dihydro-2,3-dihydroxybenzoate dehydrogenase [Rhodococcus sp. (in: high G+C Gram-positive bacteria)]|uniref:2,3-dihydro-2,3-dihydroxybenzoate dehydrogenase n=1 Tax=Rhodococcus sp. TaxID=1831 RepID=UPI001A28502F|nr:2,3-dihydro-2,3-dihydroxybenzoate dehydrogenase [Rhodococcus sp. (in: high G+C Gram-positive bacteria)]MBJ7477726.1 2,3-dihydro-2,3-dihydroxybenzoate dehydrogenase [Rhodococcus sp. (in: high G+C Gram-positive bacteria)]